jgi:ABC-2 type transport system ATP-binding protein
VREVVQYLKERGKTVFLNSHLLSEVERSCDQVAIINKGRVVVQGVLDELLVNRSVVRVELRRVEPRVLDAAAKVAQKIHPVDERCFTAEVASEDDIPELARAILDAGGALIGLQAHRETLEDLFIQTVEAEGK